MDHIVELPNSKGFDTILMVICHLIKQALFIPCHTTNNTPEFANPLFVSHFWQLVCKALEIKTNLSTTYHLETNEHTKQNNWHAELPLAEFTYNDMPHSATRVSPFYANKGYNLQLTLSLKDIPSHIAHKVVKDLQSLHQFLWDKINTANQAYSKHANTHESPLLTGP
ncbi:hypothetical protein E4T56_gene947 [Termitomyces sp. T112]|nr:hypothetical protein E4T56_gene947 [Termitomyces sp. T112]